MKAGDDMQVQPWSASGVTCGLLAVALFGVEAAGAAVQAPPALAVQGEHDVVEGHERGAVADGDAGAPQLLHLLAEPLLHVHLHSINHRPAMDHRTDSLKTFDSPDKNGL